MVLRGRSRRIVTSPDPPDDDASSIFEHDGSTVPPPSSEYDDRLDVPPGGPDDPDGSDGSGSQSRHSSSSSSSIHIENAIYTDNQTLVNDLNNLVNLVLRFNTQESLTYGLLIFLLRNHCATAFIRAPGGPSYSVIPQPQITGISRKNHPDFMVFVLTPKDKVVQVSPRLIWEAKPAETASKSHLVGPRSAMVAKFMSDYGQVHRYAVKTLQEYPGLDYIWVTYSISTHFVALKFRRPDNFGKKSAISDDDIEQFFPRHVHEGPGSSKRKQKYAAIKPADRAKSKSLLIRLEELLKYSIVPTVSFYLEPIVVDVGPGEYDLSRQFRTMLRNTRPAKLSFRDSWFDVDDDGEYSQDGSDDDNSDSGNDGRGPSDNGSGSGDENEYKKSLKAGREDVKLAHKSMFDDLREQIQAMWGTLPTRVGRSPKKIVSSTSSDSGDHEYKGESEGSSSSPPKRRKRKRTRRLSPDSEAKDSQGST